MWQITFNVAESTRADVFAVLDQDTDDVIEIINYIIERGEAEQETSEINRVVNNNVNNVNKNVSQNIWDYI